MVDDHPAILRHVAVWVQGTGVATVAATSVESADAHLLYGSLKPDIVLCDMHMPEVDGLEVCRRIVALDPCAAVILFSARDDDGLADVAAQAGASALIKKTADSEALRAELVAAVRRRSARQSTAAADS